MVHSMRHLPHHQHHNFYKYDLANIEHATTRTQGIHTREKERKPLAIAVVSLVPELNIAPYITQASASAPLVQEFCYEVNHNSGSMNLMDIINCKKREKNNSKALTGGPGK